MVIASSLLPLVLLAFPLASVQTGTSVNPSNIPSVKQWDAAVDKANRLISKLSLAEKIGVVTGNPGGDISSAPCVGRISPIPRVGFGGFCLQDGPTALNRHHLVSVFPAGITAAATWDRDQILDRGVAIGEEYRGKGIHVMLGPSVGPIGRHPLGGRNWESFSPDPYLSGEAIRLTTVGVQSSGVQTCAKHYIGNEQETRRTSVSSNIDDRTLHELYLWPFADAIRAGTTSLMTGHNKLNQTFASENPRVLQTILRKELGFRGYVMSDWWGTHSTSGAANSGLDMEQPGIAGALGRAYWGSTLEAAVNTGNVTKERIDDMVRHVLTPYYLLNQDDGKFPSIDPSAASVMNAAQVGFPSGPTMPQIPGRDVRGNHARLIRKMGAAGTVLLKNSGGFLPLRKTANIGVFGNDAGPPTDGLANLDYSPPPGFEFGTLTIGGGAGAARHSNLVVPLEAIHSRNPSAQVQYITSHRIILANDFRTIYPVPEVCLVFLKTFAAESWDRSSFENDWNSTQVVENVATLCPKRTVVITHSAGANTMPWASNPNVVAILAAHFPGEETGNAIVDILWGDVEPSGRLPYTIPKTPADYDIPVVSGGNLQANFTEGQLIDYRHFDSNNIEPLFEFGFGLGYTTFEIENNIDIKNIGSEKITATPAASTTVPPGGNDKLWTELVRAEITVKNSGKREGAAVPQLYLSFPKDTVPKDTPVKVLRGFDKVTLKPGERKKVTFTLKRRDLSYWNVSAQEWRIPAGKFTVSVGLSSRNLRVQKQIEIVSK